MIGDGRSEEGMAAAAVRDGKAKLAGSGGEGGPADGADGMVAPADDRRMDELRRAVRTVVGGDAEAENRDQGAASQTGR